MRVMADRHIPGRIPIGDGPRFQLKFEITVDDQDLIASAAAKAQLSNASWMRQALRNTALAELDK